MLVIPGPWLTLNLLGEVADSIEAGRTVRWRATYERTSTFLPAWGLALTAGLAISFGLALCVIPGALLMVAWFHAPRFVAQGRPVFQALGDSHRLLRRSDDWVATLLNGLVLVAFAVAMGFSAVLTAVVLPLGMAYLALCTQDTVHGGTDPLVLSAGGDGVVIEERLSFLLPRAFGPAHLG